MKKTAIGMNGDNGRPKIFRTRSLTNKERESRQQHTQVIEDLLEEQRRRGFFEGLAQDYAALNANSQVEE